MISFYFQQIEEPQAKKLFHKKVKSGKKSKLYQGVPDAATSLCRRILQYKNYKGRCMVKLLHSR